MNAPQRHSELILKLAVTQLHLVTRSNYNSLLSTTVYILHSTSLFFVLYLRDVAMTSYDVVIVVVSSTHNQREMRLPFITFSPE